MPLFISLMCFCEVSDQDNLFYNFENAYFELELGLY